MAENGPEQAPRSPAEEPAPANFGGETTQFQLLLDPARLAGEGFFRAEEVGALVADHHARRNLNDKAIFSLLMFSKWLAARTGQA